MWYKVYDANIFTKTFAKMIVIINSITMAHFFQTIYYDIFKYLLATSFKDEALFGPNFSIIEINN